MFERDVLQDTLKSIKEKTYRDIVKYVSVLVLVIFVVEIGFLINNLIAHTMVRSMQEYVRLYILIPTGCNLLMCITLHYVSKLDTLRDNVKDTLMIIPMFVICLVVATVHSYFAPMQCVFSAIIICSALIGTRNLIVFSYVLSVIGVICMTPFSRYFNESLTWREQIEHGVVSVTLLLMVAVLSNAVLKNKSRNIKVISDYADSLEDAIDVSKRDGMTKLYNHAEFYNVLSFMNKNSERVSVAVMDIDWFKKVNDTYGHDNGDTVLIAIANLCNDICDNKNIISFRYGGEEFAIVFNDVAYHDCIKCVENLLQEVRALKFNFGENVRVTMSAGLFSCRVGMFTEEEIFEKADEALYYSKEHGRNQMHSTLVDAGSGLNKIL